MLADLVLGGNGKVVAGQNGERLPIIVNIFARIFETKFINEQTAKKMGRILHLLMQTEETKVQLETAIAPLEDFLKKKLDRLVVNSIKD